MKIGKSSDIMTQKQHTKSEKHVQDNEKRKESVLKKFKEKQSQKEIIRKALSSNSVGERNKIIFDEEIVTNEEEKKVRENIKKKELDKVKLFDDSESEETYEIKIKNQFEGKKGHKLLNLQSNYNNDERFKLDERFYDDDGEDHENCRVSDEEGQQSQSGCSESQEKLKQLEVLKSVLGDQIKPKDLVGKKSKRSFFEMVRFDASNEDHRRQDEFDEENDVKPKTKRKKLSREERKQKKKEAQNKDNTENISQKVSNKKYYEVSDDLKFALKNKKTDSSQFKLLPSFSKEEKEGELSGQDADEDAEEASHGDHNKDNRCNNRDMIVMEDKKEAPNANVEKTKVRGISREKFFFTDDDHRLEEGLKFMNMKSSEEAKIASKNYEITRRDIREVLRLRWQKHRQKNNPFRKKIGGSSIKKLGKPGKFFKGKK